MNLIENAREELKRADHLIYVSLKYTRTCDIIMNTVKRLIESFEYTMTSLLDKLKEKKKVKIIPDLGVNKAELLEKIDKKYKNYMKLYLLLKKIESCRFEGREEYRKHVTMIVHMDKKVMEVDVPTLEDYYAKTKEFVDFAESEIE